MSSHFYPTSGVYKTHEDAWEVDNALRYEGLKKSFTATLMATESCMGKCWGSGNEPRDLSADEASCVRQCSLKYFDAQLIIENELDNFTHGQQI
jgi:hypothetical protein